MEEIYFKTDNGVLCRKSFKEGKSLAFIPSRKWFSRNEFAIWNFAEERGSIKITKEEFDSAIYPYLEQLNDPSLDAEAIAMRENNHPMYWHVHSTIEEKVEILAQNPYRYYKEINLWIGQNTRRLEPLDKYLKIAEAQERYELCKRIVEVKELLMSIYNKL